MFPRGLSWRIGLPFVLLVLAETVTLAVYTTMQIAAEERARLERVAEADAEFLRVTGLPRSQRMAEDLERVTGFKVHFRSARGLEPAAEGALGEALGAVTATGTAQRIGDHEAAAVDLGDGVDLVLVRSAAGALWHPRIVQVVVSFWVLAVVFAWVIVRGIVRPLRSLAQKLPGIEQEAALDVPEARRADEIGDLARAFTRARQALHDERDRRQRMEKTAVLGRMTASLAHEIQNPVAAIKMHAQLLRGGEAAAAAETIEHEAGRIEELLQQWQFLSRPEPPALGEHDLGALLDAIVRAHRAQLAHAEVRVVRTQQGPLTVACDSRRLRHVFGNLLTNAVQAMPHGGELAIDARGDGEAVEVRFTDGGRGFSAEALRRFAEFFYSEKEGGMGIGLGVAREIVRAHGGSLAAANVAAGGASVTVRLLRRGPAAEPRAAGAAAEPRGGA